jgi:ribosome-binding factor A
VSRRQERVASLIRTILGEALQAELNDPRIPPITSITRVEVAADFSVAHVYVSVMAPEARRTLALTALQGSAGHLRWLLGRQMRLRKLPALDFRLDESLRLGFETVQVIDRLMAELGPPAAAEDTAEAQPTGPEADPGIGDSAGGAAQEDTPA